MRTSDCGHLEWIREGMDLAAAAVLFERPDFLRYLEKLNRSCLAYPILSHMMYCCQLPTSRLSSLHFSHHFRDL